MVKAEAHLPIVRPAQFLQSTRESGYRSTPLALAELIDNSIEAKAGQVEVRIIPSKVDADTQSDENMKVHEVAVIDNGVGMSGEAIASALSFGGSSRFGNRDGMGRFGMGLPNASVSQCRHIEVYSWQDGGKPKFTQLDMDAIVESAGELLAPPSTKPLPVPYAQVPHPDSGTVIVWKKCDRLDRGGKVKAIHAVLKTELGRIYRHFLANNQVKLLVGGEVVEPIDPLYLMDKARVQGDVLAEMFGAPTEVDIPIPSKPGQSAKATVTCSVLPWDWQRDFRRSTSEAQEAKEKRHLSETTGISIVRAGREIRIIRNPYHARHWTDAWYRVEVRFGPELDEVFGVTHTKQDVKLDEHTPAYGYLEAVIVPRVQQMRNIIVERRGKVEGKKPTPAAPIPLAQPETGSGKRTPGRPPALKLSTQTMVADETVDAKAAVAMLKKLPKELMGHRLRITIQDMGPSEKKSRKREPATA